jgi:hypothetical protein
VGHRKEVKACIRGDNQGLSGAAAVKIWRGRRFGRNAGIIDGMLVVSYFLFLICMDVVGWMKRKWGQLAEKKRKKRPRARPLQRPTLTVVCTY